MNKIFKTITLVLSCFLVFGCGSSDGDSADTTPKTMEEKLDEILKDAIGINAPGISLRVLGDGIDMTIVKGVASLDTSETLTAEHRFHTASIGKSFMGVAFAKLVQDGYIDSDNTLDTWLPTEVTSRIPQATEITATQLLNHTSGIMDFLNESDVAAIAIEADQTHIWTNAELVQFVYDQNLNFAPGTSFSYSNTNFCLLAIILEEITGNSHAASLRELVFTLLDMTTTFTSNHDQVTGSMTMGHIVEGNNYDEAMEIVNRWEAGSGGQWTTIGDLTKFIHGLFETNDVLSDDGREVLQTGSNHAPYGYGMLFIDEEDGRGTIAYHDGLLLGHNSYMSYFMDRNLSVVMYVNAEAYDNQGNLLAADLYQQILNVIFE